jgi:hypothetical protein
MSLTPKVINVDEEDWQALPSGQRSDIIRKFIKDYNNSIKGNLNDINVEVLKMQIVTLENQKIKIDTELQSKRSQIEAVNKVQEEGRLKTLEEDKKRIENAKKCVICGFARADAVKMHKFPVGQICQTCYMEKRDTKRWFIS